MAEVYCADDIQLGRRVAVKLLHERFAADEEFVERFRREASSAASLSHANIVNVYDRGEWAGTYYIVDGVPRRPLARLDRARGGAARRRARDRDHRAGAARGALRPPPRRSSTATSSRTT